MSRPTGDFVPGSPLNALLVRPPFREHFLIDVDARRIGSLRKRIGEHCDVHLYEGDCNEILLNKVFPVVEYKDFAEDCASWTHMAWILTGSLWSPLDR